jgi:hypothetical protein
LNVTIGGNGFNKGAKAKWYVSGTTNSGGVVVNSTTFVSSTEVVANITIPETATVSGYDVLVSNTSGRTGVGSDLFTINPEAVTSYVYDIDANNNAVTVQGDDVVLSQLGASTYSNTPSNCSTAPHSNCTLMSLLPNDWYLGLTNQTYRSLRLTFVALGSSPDRSALNGLYPAHVATRCFDANNNWMSIPTTIPVGTPNPRCSLRIDQWFSASGIRYLFIMSPANAPGTGWSTVTCIAGNPPTQTCNEWTITPTPMQDPSRTNVGNLYTVANSGKLTLVGTYKMTFNIRLTQP